jgi:adenylate kinase family enzyme
LHSPSEVNLSKTLIFGNSGSGKSTLAKKISAKQAIAHLDLDTIAWQAASPPARTPIAESKAKITRFIEANESWVIEGCYADLLSLVMEDASEVFFLDIPVEDCILNAKNRAWESHKYESKTAQDSNLPMLIEWITQYSNREDCFSHKAHYKLYNVFNGKKTLYTSNHHTSNVE